MALETINPTTGERLKTFDQWNDRQVEAVLAEVSATNVIWQATSFAERAHLFRNIAAELRNNAAHYAALITLEMGKIVQEARAEIEKCALGCEFYAEHAEELLRDEMIETDAGSSYVAYLPLGTVLAVMPWNFPFWQVFRFAAPSLMAGNTAVLKHASNVPHCALAIEDIFHRAGFPQGVFRTLMISAAQVDKVIADPRVQAVTLTGSDAAGRNVAATAGANLKKTVLELGGSDGFIVLSDADLEMAASVGVMSRFLNCGQSCIAAKRFILSDSVADQFIDLFKQKTRALRMGDPAREDTQLGPMARADLRDRLHKQVTDSVAAGPGFFYEPTIIDRVRPGMRAYEEELFGPVAIVIRAANDEDTVRIANDSRYGLGASLWTRITKKGERLARNIQSGASFVNGLVKSDPRLPFGGIKNSGYGRELSVHGIREFVNIKTMWIR